MCGVNGESEPTTQVLAFLRAICNLIDGFVLGATFVAIVYIFAVKRIQLLFCEDLRQDLMNRGWERPELPALSLQLHPKWHRLFTFFRNGTRKTMKRGKARPAGVCLMTLREEEEWLDWSIGPTRITDDKLTSTLLALTSSTRDRQAG
jgi:hypothetical protein